MARLAIVLAAGLLVLACGDNDAAGPSGPGPGPGEEVDYFPFTVGNTWLMTRSGTGSNGQSDYTVTGSYSITVTRTLSHQGGFEVFEVLTAGQDTIHLETGPRPQEPYSYIDLVRDAETALTSYTDTISTIPEWTIPLPPEVGATWLYTSTPMEIWAGVASLTEELTAPAGSFEDVLLITMAWAPDSASTDSLAHFFAPDVGFLSTARRTADTVAGSWLETEDLLTSYTVQTTP